MLLGGHARDRGCFLAWFLRGLSRTWFSCGTEAGPTGIAANLQLEFIPNGSQRQGLEKRFSTTSGDRVSCVI